MYFQFKKLSQQALASNTGQCQSVGCTSLGVFALLFLTAHYLSFTLLLEVPEKRCVLLISGTLKMSREIKQFCEIMIQYVHSLFEITIAVDINTALLILQKR